MGTIPGLFLSVYRGARHSRNNNQFFSSEIPSATEGQRVIGTEVTNNSHTGEQPPSVLTPHYDLWRSRKRRGKRTLGVVCFSRVGCRLLPRTCFSAFSSACCDSSSKLINRVTAPVWDTVPSVRYSAAWSDFSRPENYLPGLMWSGRCAEVSGRGARDPAGICSGTHPGSERQERNGMAQPIMFTWQDDNVFLFIISRKLCFINI